MEIEVEAKTVWASTDSETYGTFPIEEPGYVVNIQFLSLVAGQSASINQIGK